MIYKRNKIILSKRLFCLLCETIRLSTWLIKENAIKAETIEISAYFSWFLPLILFFPYVTALNLGIRVVRGSDYTLPEPESQSEPEHPNKIRTNFKSRDFIVLRESGYPHPNTLSQSEHDETKFIHPKPEQNPARIWSGRKLMHI